MRSISKPRKCVLAVQSPTQASALHPFANNSPMTPSNDTSTSGHASAESAPLPIRIHRALQHQHASGSGTGPKLIERRAPHAPAPRGMVTFVAGEDHRTPGTRSHPPTPHHAAKAKCAHQPRHRASGHHDALAVELAPDLAYPVDPEVLPHPPDLLTELAIAAIARRTPTVVPLPGLALVRRRRGDRQHCADRLDPVLVAMSVDEPRDVVGRRSSSAWAKYADALRRISFARRRSRFSRFNALSRSRSALVTPARRP